MPHPSFFNQILWLQRPQQSAGQSNCFWMHIRVQMLAWGIFALCTTSMATGWLVSHIFLRAIKLVPTESQAVQDIDRILQNMSSFLKFWPITVCASSPEIVSRLQIDWVANRSAAIGFFSRLISWRVIRSREEGLAEFLRESWSCDTALCRSGWTCWLLGMYTSLM